MKTKFRYSLGQLFRRLFGLASSQKKTIVLATIGSIIGNVARMSLMGCGAMMIICSMPKSGESPVVWGVLFGLSALIIAGMRYLEGVEAHVAAYSLLAELRTSFYHKLRQLAPACLVDRQKGDIISIAIADIDTIEKFFAHTIGPMFTVILLPLITLIFAGSIRIQFALYLFPIYILISILIPLAAMKAGRDMGARYRNQLGDIKSLILESVYGLKDIQIFGIGRDRLEKVHSKSREINRTAHGLTIHKQLVNALPTFFIYLSRILIVLTALWLGLEDKKELTGVVVLSFIVSASFSSTQSLISVVTSLLETFAAAERLFIIMDDLPAVSETEEPLSLREAGEVSLSEVSFRYGEDRREVLDKVSLTINKGDKVGVIGPSGVGKSTILRLLLRFWDPTDGRITIEGKPLKDIRMRDLRDKVVLVEQSTFIYDDTARANIAFGKPDATDEEIRRAAKRAGIANLIERLPDGYETQLGEFGSHLSGGEKQRIGIARIMLLDPDVIVMDEPTSSLDVFNEKLLLKTLEDEYSDKTIIIVSHRQSTLTLCNRIYRLDSGKLEVTS